jgi:AcrR family transcriptional regulator
MSLVAVGSTTPADRTAPTAERVRAAAVTLFAERGFHGTGIRDLAEAAGLSSATLYHYMGTKEDLLVALMTTSLDRLLEAARVVVDEEDVPLDQLAGLVRMHVREHALHRLETSVVDGEVRALAAPARRTVQCRRDAYEALWRDVLESGRAAGVMAVEDTDLARLALLEMCSGVSRWYSPRGRLDLDALAERYVAMAIALVTG